MSWLCPRCTQIIVPSAHNCGAVPPHPARLLNDYTEGQLPRLRDVLQHGGVAHDLAAKYFRAYMAYKETEVDGGCEWMRFAAKYTDTDLCNPNLTRAEHLEIIDEIWRSVVEFRGYEETVGEMLDPREGNHPSSLTRPDDPVFRTQGLCFRCDTRLPTSVLQTGFLPANKFMPSEEMIDTIMHNCTTGLHHTPMAVGFWRKNQDVVSQTSVCVSRTLRGCGKFPSPEDKGIHYMYAFKVDTGKSGFDTEAAQAEDMRWQPGEKAFPDLMPAEIAAWTIVYKNGSNTGGRNFDEYYFRLVEPSWNFVNRAAGDAPLKQYLDAELKALCAHGRDITVLRTEDFVPIPA